MNETDKNNDIYIMEI